jgi:pyruvate formate lyase activating enzyme
MSSIDWSGSNLPILKMYPFSSTDGLGNRYGVYLAGCNFNCKSCHNPESIQSCINCGECVSSCEFNALTFHEGRVIYNPNNCTGCDECIHTCNYLSSPRLFDWTDEKLLQDIQKRRDYIRGVTFSGGEATLHYKRLVPIIKRIKEMGLEVLIDTNGSFLIDKSFQEFLDLVDGFMVDIKFYDDVMHREYTGVSNENVLKNIPMLQSLEKLVEVRTVLYGKPNNVAEIKKISTLFSKDILYKIIPYHTYGVRKNFRPLFEVPSKEVIKAVKLWMEQTERNYTVVEF